MNDSSNIFSELSNRTVGFFMSSLMKGTAILTIGLFLSKLLGLVYIFPFYAIVGIILGVMFIALADYVLMRLSKGV